MPKTISSPIPSNWPPRASVKESAHGFFGRKKALAKMREYVVGVKSGGLTGDVMCEKGLKIFSTVGTMGIGKTVCVGVG